MKKFSNTFKTLFCAFSLLMLQGNGAAQAQEEFTKAQKDQINKMIGEYILQNPEILPQAIQLLRERQKSQMLSQYHDAIYNDGYSFVGGNPEGDVTLVEFFDYNCGYCKNALVTLEKLTRIDPNVRIIYKEFPILSPSSVTAAKAAMASIKQGKYYAFHKAMLTNKGNLDEARIFEIARQVGLDEQQLAIDMTDPEFDKAIHANTNLAQNLQITGTPGFIIGNFIVPGEPPLGQMIKAISDVRESRK